MAKLKWTTGPLVSQESEQNQENEQQGSSADEVTEDQEFIIYRLNTNDSSFINNVFFYTNILWYLLYCSYIAGFSLGEYSEYDFKTTRDFCVEGAFYEVQNATHLRE